MAGALAGRGAVGADDAPASVTAMQSAGAAAVAVAGATAVVVAVLAAIGPGVPSFDRGTGMPTSLVNHPAPQFARPLASVKGGTFSLGRQHGWAVLVTL